MTSDRDQFAELPHVGREVGSPPGGASGTYQSVVVLLATLIAALGTMAAGFTLIVAIGYVLGGYVGAIIPVAVVAMILRSRFALNRLRPVAVSLAAYQDRPTLGTRRTLGVLTTTRAAADHSVRAHLRISKHKPAAASSFS